MTSAQYWAKRAVADKIASLNATKKQMRLMRRIFAGTKKDLQTQIDTILKSISGDLAEARRIVSNKELLALRKRYDSLISMLDDKNTAPLANALMDKLHKSSRVTRLDAMLAQVDYYSLQMYKDSGKLMQATLLDAAKTAYYRKAYDFEMLAGMELNWNTIDARRLDVLINESWKGKNWSKRLWGHVEKFDEKLKEVIGRGILTGEDTHRMAAELSKLTSSTRANAERIMRTETAYVAERATMTMYDEMEVDKYRYLATLDLKTSSICREKDGKVYLRTDAKVGINMPPLHPNCRSTTIPEFDDMHIQERAARDPQTGKTVRVKDMTYKEWYENRVATKLKDSSNKGSARGASFSKEAADMLYPDLKPEAKNAIIKAHNDVLDYGLKNKKEKAIAIDWRTGKYIKANTGMADSVVIDIEKHPLDSLILVHNHPSGQSFSVDDIIAVNQVKSLRALVAQGHNGASYLLRIGKGRRFDTVPEFELREALIYQVEQLQELLYEPGMTRSELSHRIIKELADSYGWEYKRQNPRNTKKR